MSEEVKEAQDKPLWEQQGYTSVEEMYADLQEQNADLRGKGAAERARADSLEKELGSASVPTVPTFDQKAYEEDPQGYLEKHQKDLETYRVASEEGPKKVTKATLNATANSVLAEAVEKGYDKIMVQSVMRSMVSQEPEKGNLLNSPDGIRELGKQAMEKLKAQMKPLHTPTGGDEGDELEENEVAKEVPNEHRDRPGRSSAGAKRSTPKQSEVDRLADEISTGVTEKRLYGADLVGKVIDQNLAHLGVERPKK